MNQTMTEKEEVKTEKNPVNDIWERAGRNEPLTPEEYAIYVEEVAKRRAA